MGVKGDPLVGPLLILACGTGVRVWRDTADGGLVVRWDPLAGPPRPSGLFPGEVPICSCHVVRMGEGIEGRQVVAGPNPIHLITRYTLRCVSHPRWFELG